MSASSNQQSFEPILKVKGKQFETGGWPGKGR